MRIIANILFMLSIIAVNESIAQNKDSIMRYVPELLPVVERELPDENGIRYYFPPFVESKIDSVFSLLECKNAFLKIISCDRKYTLIIYKFNCEPHSEENKVDLILRYTNRYYLTTDSNYKIPIIFDLDNRFSFATFVFTHYYWKYEFEW